MTSYNEEFWTVIPATGIGQRMLADRPKQYLKLGSRSILEHTLDNLLSHPRIGGAILVLNARDNFWPALNYQHSKPIITCEGGKERYHSVYNGLNVLHKAVLNDPVVLIHDAVRPFVSHTDLDRLIIETSTCKDGAILAAPVTDTLKQADAQAAILHTQPRDNLWRAFTPQAFQLSKIKQALESVMNNDLNITDDASAMELAGFKPRLVSCDPQNIKITRPQDMRLAEIILQSGTH